VPEAPRSTRVPACEAGQRLAAAKVLPVLFSHQYEVAPHRPHVLREDAEALQQDVEPLDRVLGAGRHLLALINDILDLSKIEAGRMELQLDDFAFAPLIDSVAKPLSHSRQRVRTNSWSVATLRSDRCMLTRCGCGRRCSIS
jgi:signal transduction histidine kinase